MGYEARKTEHSGPKRGNGAYWGYRWDAKKESNRIRRENWKREIRDRGAAAETGSAAPPASGACQENHEGTLGGLAPQEGRVRVPPIPRRQQSIGMLSDLDARNIPTRS